jgi:hypothetical protein
MFLNSALRGYQRFRNAMLHEAHESKGVIESEFVSDGGGLSGIGMIR